MLWSCIASDPDESTQQQDLGVVCQSTACGGGGGGGGGGSPPRPTPFAAGVLPQGTTCGLQYLADSDWPWNTGGYEGSDCRQAFIPGNTDWVSPSTTAAFPDGDIGGPEGTGFGHLEYAAAQAVTDWTQGDRFVLPQGTACGFHHTMNTPGRTCMGLDPATNACPVGWTAKRHFDMSSGAGYFVWCEYNDKWSFCDASCLITALYEGYTCGLDSSTDATGHGTCNRAVVPACPAGAWRSQSYDLGRPSGQGLSWCHD